MRQTHQADCEPGPDYYPAVQLADQATDQAQRSITTFHVE